MHVPILDNDSSNQLIQGGLTESMKRREPIYFIFFNIYFLQK